MSETRDSLRSPTNTRAALDRPPSFHRPGTLPFSTGKKLNLGEVAQDLFRLRRDIEDVVPKVERGGEGRIVVFDRSGEMRQIEADTGWTTFSNLSSDKTCNADSTSVAELADILGSLIEHLKTAGILDD